jgi:hypothetical protein
LGALVARLLCRRRVGYRRIEYIGITYEIGAQGSISER